MPFANRMFLGEIPLLDAEKLPEGIATVAKNAKLQRGTLEPWRAAAFVHRPTKAGVKKTIYRFGESSTTDTNFWFSWITDVDVIRSGIKGDTSERTYFTGDGYPKKTDTQMALTSGTDYPVSAYRLGLPQPDVTGATVTVGGTPLDDKDSTILGAYVVTYVSSWGEESARSDRAIGTFEFKNGQSMTINGLPVPPSGNWNIPIKRIYRSNTGSQSAQYQFVAEIPAAQTSFVDNVRSENLGEICVTEGWYAPPDNGFGLCLGANGNAIMLSGRTIHACEPFMYYAWPEAYENDVDSDLVGCGAFGQGFVILTKSNPYVLTGVDPAGYTLSKLADKQACVSKVSIVEMMGGVIYASPDGLWGIDGSGAKCLTEKLFTKDQWAALNPSTMHAYEYDNRYIAFFDSGCIVFDFTREPFIERLDINCTAAYLDPLRDSLYICQNGDINKFDAGAALTYTYRSGDYRAPRSVGYGYAKVDATSYPLTFRLFADVEQANGTLQRTLIHTENVASYRPFRLPPIKAACHAYEIEGNATVKGVAVAGSGEEIVKL